MLDVHKYMYYIQVHVYKAPSNVNDTSSLFILLHTGHPERPNCSAISHQHTSCLGQNFYSEESLHLHDDDVPIATQDFISLKASLHVRKISPMIIPSCH